MLILQVLPEASDHLSGKPGNIKEFDSCQGNVRILPKILGNIESAGENFCQKKNCFLQTLCSGLCQYLVNFIAFLVILLLIKSS